MIPVGFDLPEDYFENDDYFLDAEEAYQLLEDERNKMRPDAAHIAPIDP